MKMIAASKLSRAQRAMTSAKEYGKANTQIFTHSGAKAAPDAKILWLVVSSDKGMCGGIHSSVAKYTNRNIGDAGAEVVVLGDKSKAQMGRTKPDAIRISFNQIGSNVPTFADACAVADIISSSGLQFDQVNIVYNRFVSAISYEADVMSVFTDKALREAPNFESAYDMEEDVAKDLSDFALANAIFSALVEGHASEISAKRNAMDNASKNAGEMISSLQIRYNRGRQAIITNELIDIITGASAL